MTATPRLNRYYYADGIGKFRRTPVDDLIGQLTRNHRHDLTIEQREAWIEQIGVLSTAIPSTFDSAQIYFEYSIPRLGRRADAILVANNLVFVIEFKVGSTTFESAALDQVWDYALDLKNFHSTSHDRIIVPVLIATNAVVAVPVSLPSLASDGVLPPICATPATVRAVIEKVLAAHSSASPREAWDSGQYSPTPTIIEAAQALYAGHAVHEISRTDAAATNLTLTSQCLESLIQRAKFERRKTVCFVTGVPGAGKTLVGLDVATRHIDVNESLHSVFLSGNGPLVDVLREALARDKIRRSMESGFKLKKGDALREVKMFIQSAHHFRDECLADFMRPPVEHVTIFDEAQRAWNREQTSGFMRRKRGVQGFHQSESEFLISCMDRHPDWAVVVCLVGGGQEIHTGESGIREWIDSVNRSFPDWDLVISSRLSDSEYAVGESLESARQRGRLEIRDELHLGVSNRSFRSESVSLFVKQLLDGEAASARQTYASVEGRFPIVLTRNLASARDWVRSHARGGERFGLVVSSNAHRLKPHAIDVRAKIDPLHWFLSPKSDVRSSYYLEDAATEFQVQGLELDWTCVTWDGDFRKSAHGWDHFSFIGDRWTRILKAERQGYLKNAYRVLLTRARQGMVIVVPDGSATDPTRTSAVYDSTFHYLAELGLTVVP